MLQDSVEVFIFVCRLLQTLDREAYRALSISGSLCNGIFSYYTEDMLARQIIVLKGLQYLMIW